MPQRFPSRPIAENRCAAFFVSPVAPDFETRRQQLIEQLTRQIMRYDAEFRREEATSAVGSHAKH